MAKARIETHTEGRAASPRELGAAIRAALVVCAALLAVVLFDAVGLVSAIDDSLRDRWVRLGEAAGNVRATNSRVVLVAADIETVEGWGPPPWPAERLAELLEQIEAGDPVLVAEVGHTRMFEPGEELDRVLFDSDVPVLIGGGSPWVGVGVEHGDIVLDKDSRMHLIARTADLDPIGDRLPVHWMVPASRLPTVPANRVPGDKNLRKSFRQRLVLLGVTDPNYDMLLDTPLGRMSPAEIEAHALTGLADGAVWSELPVPLVYLLCAGFAVFLLWCFVRLSGNKAVVIVVMSTVLVLVVDFACYQRGVLRLGSARLLLTVGAVGLSYWVHEALETFAGLRQLRTRVLRDAAGGVSGDSELDDLGFWEDLAELGAEYAQEAIAAAATSSIVERVGTTWELRLRASSKTLDADSHAALAAREGLDLRRAPFRTPWLTLRAGWAAELLPSGARFGKRKTLIVPLEDEAELLGLWLVHVDESFEVAREAIETFERLGRQMASAMVRRRERMSLREQAGRGRLRDSVQTIVGGLRLLRDEHRWALELLEQLPVRALIATVWGEIEFVDPRLQEDLTRRYPGLFSPDLPENNLRVVLTRLTGKSIEEANRLMRKVVNTGVELELDAKPGIEDPGDDVWVLSRIRSKRGIELPGFKPAVHEHILLMARSSAPAQTVRTRSGGLLRVLRGGSGES